MRRYETITIVDPDLSEDERKPVLDRITDLISQQDGLLVFMDEWGSKKLAYEIKKKSHGYYVRVDYCGTGGLVDEIERFFRIDDRVLKYMTVLLDETADIESIKNEIALAENEAKKAALSKVTEPETISEEITESDTQAEGDVEPATPGDESESEPPLEKTAEARADAEGETEPEVPGDELESKPLSDNIAEAQADTESKSEQAVPSDETGSEPLLDKTAEAESKSEDGSENDIIPTSDSKKEEQ
jgi:small subunit ribosomal protein S6